MSNNYFIANENLVIGCTDSMAQEVDLSNLTELSISLIKAPNLNVDKKAAVTAININIIPPEAITTSLVDGKSVTFVSAIGMINGNSQFKTQKISVCLADSSITPATASTYTGNASIGTLTVVGTNSSSGATITDICTLWIKDAGQNKTKAV